MNEKLKMMMGNVLRVLGIKAFNKDAEGAMTLTAEEKKKIGDAFTEKFANAFADALPLFKEVKLQDEPSAEEETVDSLMNVLREGSANKLESGLKALQAQLSSEKLKNKNLQDALDIMAGEAEEVPVAEFPKNKLSANSGPGKGFRYDANSYFYTATNQLLSTGYAPTIEAASIEVGDLKTEFGKYLSQNGNGLKMLTKLFKEFSSAKYFTEERAVTEWRAVQALITSVSMQFTSVWTPGGKAAFFPLKIVNRRHKINYPIIPASVLDSYMFHLYNEELAPDQMPITLYIWNKMIYPALLQDIEMRMIWKGKFIDHEATQTENSAATPPEDSMDGIETILVEQKELGAGSKMNFYKPNVDFDFRAESEAGNWDAILNFVEGFVGWLSPFYITTEMPLFLSPDNIKLYKRAYKNKWGTNSGQSGDFGSDRVDYSNQMLAAPVGMFKSPIIFSTPKENMIKLRHRNEVPNIINDVQKHGYEVRLFGEYWLAVGFAIANAVFAYVPDGYDPKSTIVSALGAHTTYQDTFNNGTGEDDSDDSGL